MQSSSFVMRNQCDPIRAPSALRSGSGRDPPAHPEGKSRLGASDLVQVSTLVPCACPQNLDSFVFARERKGSASTCAHKILTRLDAGRTLRNPDSFESVARAPGLHAEAERACCCSRSKVKVGERITKSLSSEKQGAAHNIIRHRDTDTIAYDVRLLMRFPAALVKSRRARRIGKVASDIPRVICSAGETKIGKCKDGEIVLAEGRPCHLSEQPIYSTLRWRIARDWINPFIPALP
ncbi:hypothetical protein B0H19DRAFT_240425 [Mycena capillaripes]|nr:hypothetical protein B0H19DRAFT_240425 [Mycena capillaripes]